MRYYDRREAEGAKIVRQMDKGRVATDIYLLHEVIFPGKEVFLLTNKRAVYAVANSVLGGWSSEWEYLYHEIHDMPTIQQEGSRWFIIIHPKVRGSHYKGNPSHENIELSGGAEEHDGTVWKKFREEDILARGLQQGVGPDAGEDHRGPADQVETDIHSYCLLILTFLCRQDNFDQVFLKMIHQKANK